MLDLSCYGSIIRDICAEARPISVLLLWLHGGHLPLAGLVWTSNAVWLSVLVPVSVASVVTKPTQRGTCSRQASACRFCCPLHWWSVHCQLRWWHCSDCRESDRTTSVLTLQWTVGSLVGLPPCFETAESPAVHSEAEWIGVGEGGGGSSSALVRVIAGHQPVFAVCVPPQTDHWTHRTLPLSFYLINFVCLTHCLIYRSFAQDTNHAPTRWYRIQTTYTMTQDTNHPHADTGYKPPAQWHRIQTTYTMTQDTHHLHNDTGYTPPTQWYRIQTTYTMTQDTNHPHADTGYKPPAQWHRIQTTYTMTQDTHHLHNDTGYTPPTQWHRIQTTYTMTQDTHHLHNDTGYTPPTQWHRIRTSTSIQDTSLHTDTGYKLQLTAHFHTNTDHLRTQTNSTHTYITTFTACCTWFYFRPVRATEANKHRHYGHQSG